MPLNVWNEAMEDPTLADAILDRLIHNVHHNALKGESMRKSVTEWLIAAHQSRNPIVNQPQVE